MSAIIRKELEKLEKTDADVIQWAKEHGYGEFLPDNIKLVRQIYLDAHDVVLEFPDLEMRGTKVSVKDIPAEEWVIIRAYMFKIARKTTYPMCPEEGCYSRVKNSECQAREDKSHGYVAEPVKGIRHYYMAGDGKDNVYVIVPAKYAMNGYDFEGMWCDIKGIWNSTLDGFFANLILQVNGEDAQTGEVIKPETLEIDEAEPEEAIEVPKGVDVSMFASKPKPKEETAATDEKDIVYQAELKNFAQIIPFFSGHLVAQFDEYMNKNNIKSSIEDLVKDTAGCSFEGEGDARKIIFKTE